MKIVFLGDSLTQGTHGANYVNKVAAALGGHHFINEGVNGDTSLNLYRRLEKDVLAHQPDGVLIMIGINDALSYSEPGIRPYFRYIKRIRGGQITPISFRENMRAILTRLLFEQIRVWVVLPPVEYRPQTVTALKAMNASAAGLCAELNVPTLDLLRVMTPGAVPERPPIRLFPDMLLNRLGAKKDFTYSFDGLHLTETGAQQMAGAISEFLHKHGVTG